MIISINLIDGIIVTDGKSATYQAPFKPRNLRAIQWNGTNGHFEFEKGADIPFDNVELIEPYLTKFIADIEAEKEPVKKAENAEYLQKARLELGEK